MVLINRMLLTVAGSNWNREVLFTSCLSFRGINFDLWSL